MQQYEEVLKISPRDPIVLNDMAWHLRESDPDRALELADRAHTIAPKSTSIMDTLAVILIERGDTRRAKRVLQQALEIAPESPTLHYRRAMLLEASGETEQAIAELSLILEKNQDFPERADAEAMMQRLRGS
jgi:tetratricopeptide (TPR) repeat protein